MVGGAAIVLYLVPAILGIVTKLLLQNYCPQRRGIAGFNQWDKKY